MAGKGCRPDRALLIVFRKAEPSHAVSAHFDDHAAHLAVEFVFIGRADHGLVASAHGFQDLAEPLVFLLCPPALGDVVQVCGDDGLPAHASGENIHIRGQGLPIAAKAFNLEAISWHRRASLGFANGLGDGLPQRLRQLACFDAASQEFRCGPGEQCLGGAIEDNHPAVQIHPDIRFNRAADDFAKPGIAIVVLRCVQVPAPPPLFSMRQRNKKGSGVP